MCDLSIVHTTYIDLKTTYRGNPYDHYTLKRQVKPDPAVAALQKSVRDLNALIGTNGESGQDLKKDLVAVAVTLEVDEAQASYLRPVAFGVGLAPSHAYASMCTVGPCA